MNKPAHMSFHEWFYNNLDLAEQIRSEMGLGGMDGLSRSRFGVSIVHLPDGYYMFPGEVVREMRRRYDERKQEDERAYQRYLDSLKA